MGKNPGVAARAHSRWYRNSITVFEVGIASAFAILTALVTSSYLHASRTDVGYDPEGLFAVRLSGATLRADRMRRGEIIKEIQASLSRIQDVTHVAVGNVEPSASGGFSVVVAADALTDRVQMCWISPNYFSTLGVPVLNGRHLTAADDTAHAAPVAALNRNAALRLFGHTDVVGREVRFGLKTARVVAVVGDTRDQQIDLPGRPVLYVPAGQFQLPAVVFLRSTLSVQQLSREAVGVLKASRPMDDPPRVISVAESLENSLEPRRSRAVLFTALAVVALVLMIMGVYASVVDTAQDHLHEIAIRASLGAAPIVIVRVLTQATAVMVVGGLCVGTVGAWMTSRIISRFLFGIGLENAVAVIAGLSVACLVAFGAAFHAGIRATRVDISSLLRN